MENSPFSRSSDLPIRAMDLPQIQPCSSKSSFSRGASSCRSGRRRRRRGRSRATKPAAYLAADDGRGRRRAAPARGHRRAGCGRPEATERGGGGRVEERRLCAGRRAAGRRPRCQRQGRLAAGRSGRECHGGWSFR